MPKARNADTCQKSREKTQIRGRSARVAWSQMASSTDRSAGLGAMNGGVEALAASHKPRNDVELMAAVASQDAAAQREVLNRLGGRVRKLTGLLCRERADADDAAQLALIAILKSADGFRVATSLERWAERITVRTTLRARRRERDRRNLLERWLAPNRPPWGGNSSSEPLGIDALLERLSPDRRRTFVLHHALGYTVEEIGELSETPVGTVKDRLVSARRELRAMLEREAQRDDRRGAK
jgi:RNA polymerase sigma-70 factor (ECF subfamily)